MKGLCIGTGDWRSLAVRAAAQMEKMTGITCTVVDRVDNNLVHSSWHKLNLLRDHPGETLLIFDADLWSTQTWDPSVYTDTGLAMVPELPNAPIRIESALYHIPAGCYFNGGLIIADGRAAEIFATTKRLHPRYGSWLEQTGLNRQVQELKYPITRMPLALNRLIEPAQPLPDILAIPAINKHFAGPKTLARLHEVFDALDAARSSMGS